MRGLRRFSKGEWGLGADARSWRRVSGVTAWSRAVRALARSLQHEVLALAYRNLGAVLADVTAGSCSLILTSERRTEKNEEEVRSKEKAMEKETDENRKKTVTRAPSSRHC